MTWQRRRSKVNKTPRVKTTKAFLYAQDSYMAKKKANQKLALISMLSRKGPKNMRQIQRLQKVLKPNKGVL